MLVPLARPSRHLALHSASDKQSNQRERHLDRQRVARSSSLRRRLRLHPLGLGLPRIVLVAIVTLSLNNIPALHQVVRPRSINLHRSRLLLPIRPQRHRSLLGQVNLLLLPLVVQPLPSNLHLHLLAEEGSASAQVQRRLLLVRLLRQRHLPREGRCSLLEHRLLQYLPPVGDRFENCLIADSRNVNGPIFS